MWGVEISELLPGQIWDVGRVPARHHGVCVTGHQQVLTLHGIQILGVTLKIHKQCWLSDIQIQWSMYLKTTMKLWSYTTSGLKNKVSITHKVTPWEHIMLLYNSRTSVGGDILGWNISVMVKPFTQGMKVKQDVFMYSLKLINNVDFLHETILSWTANFRQTYHILINMSKQQIHCHFMAILKLSKFSRNDVIYIFLHNMTYGVFRNHKPGIFLDKIM